MPSRFSNSAASLSYVNGPLVKEELARLKTLQPQFIDGDYDDTDYVKEDGCFYPGCMIKSSAGGMVSAGVAVERGHEVRLTVPFHCWSEEYNKSMEEMGESDFLKVSQGESVIGHVSERVSSTDIGLAVLREGVILNNRFLGLDASAKLLIPGEKVKSRDEFVVDGFTTSVQRLVCFGRRIRKENASVEDLHRVHPNVELPSPGKCIVFEQGIMATGEPELRRSPRLREGVCGSALLRAQTTTGEDVMHNGEIAGFMHWCDLQSADNPQDPPPLLCFCESTNEVIGQGWKIVKAGEEREMEEK